MIKREQGLDCLLKRVSVAINKSPDDLEPFFNILKSNLYEREEDLHEATLEDYQRMKIPQRVAKTIMEQLSQPKLVSENKPKPHPFSNDNIKKTVLSEQNIWPIVEQLSLQLFQRNQNPRPIIQIIYKIISNIAKDPSQMKFRVLKKNNNTIQQNIIQQNACIKFIKAIGFEQNGETFELTKFEPSHFVFLEECISSLLQQGPQKDNKNEQRFLKITKFPNNQSQSGGVEAQISQQKLAQMKYIDALDKLILIRNNLMSEPPKDRRLKIYHKKYQIKNIQISQISFQQQFTKSEDQAISGYWKQIVKNNMNGMKFQSKRKIQFQYLVKQKIHKQALIRVKLPNQLIIEAYFGPMEKLNVVLQFVAQVVIGDLYLFTAPPKKVMTQKQLCLTLLDLDSVPQGSFYLGQKVDTYYINKQYVGMIKH